jgi:hypothetical protein
VVRRTVAGLVTALALLAASVAWAGWVYLHTVADPSRSDRIAHAILDNPAARSEVAADISDSLAAAANKSLAAHHAPLTVDGADPSLRAAVGAALADPRIAANIVDAITAEHAEVLGAAPAHPAAINTALLLTAVRAHLAPVDPQLARALPAVAPSQVRLPAVKVPYARQARRWAQRWDHVLAIGALVGLALGLVLGDRRAVLRRWGTWAIGAGLSWAVLPPLAVWAGDTWAKSQAAVVRAVVRGATGGVTAAAIALVVGGAAAVVVSVLLPRLHGLVPPPSAHAHARGSRAPGAPPAAAAGTVAGGTAAAATPAAAPRRWTTDTWSPSPPRTEEVPVVYDRTGRMAQGPAAPARTPPADRPVGGPPQAAPPPPVPSGPGPAARPPHTPGPPVPAPPPPARTRRPGVSQPLLANGRDDPSGT